MVFQCWIGWTVNMLCFYGTLWTWRKTWSSYLLPLQWIEKKMCGKVQRLGSVKVDSLAWSAHGLFLAYGNMNAGIFVASHVWLHLSRPSWAAAPPGMILVMKMLGSSPTWGLSVPPAMLKPRPELPCRSKHKHIKIHIRGIWLWLCHTASNNYGRTAED